MPHPLKTILWKELRENWKWAALGLLGLAFAELFALYQPTGYGELALTKQTFQLVAICGGVLIGAALGTLQILPELERDRWAALLHRPVPRITLFLGKISAGLILYLFATGVPLLLSIVCFAWPGQFASPFIPGMITPVIANAFLGVAFYALAILVALTRGLWYGRRALLVLAVLPLFLLVTTSSWMFLPTIFATVILLTAAAGTIEGNGAVRPGLRLAEFSLGLLLSAGLEAILLVLFLLLNFLPGAGTQWPDNYESHSVVVTKDGQVLIEVYHNGRTPRTLQHLDGTPVTEEKYLGNDAYNYYSVFNTLCWNLKSSQEYTAQFQAGNPHVGWNFVRRTYGENTEGTEHWYYLMGKDYLVGYDKLTHRRVGICDREGFHPPGQTPRPFPQKLLMSPSNYYPPYLGWIEGQLYDLEYADRDLRPLFTTPSGRVHSAAGLLLGSKVVYVALALDTSLQILELQGKPVVNIPYSHDAAVSTELSVATIPGGDRIFVQYAPFWNSAAERGKAPETIYVDEVDLQGHVLHSYSTINPSFSPRPGWARYTVFAGTPLVPTAIATVADALTSREPDWKSNSFFHSSDEKSSSWLILLLGGAGVGVVAAAIAARWARQAGFGRRETFGWLIFTFCLGLPGLFAFRLTAPFPTRVSCPNCARKRPLETEECPACHQAWPAPASNGTEIFAESGC